MTRTDAPDRDSALYDVRVPGRHPRETWARRAAIAVLLLIVGVGASGWLGVHSEEVSAAGGGWSMSVEYPRIARAGWDVPWTVTVTAPGSFPDQVTIAVTSDWLDLFESQGFS